MKWRLAWFYRLGLVVLLVLAFWSLWANAQPPAATNRPPADTALEEADKFQALTFDFDKIDFLKQHAFLDQPLWKYAASLIYLLLAFGVAWLLDFIVNSWLKRLAAKTKTPVDDLLLNLLRGPVKVVAFVIFLNVGLGLFNWPARAQLFLSRGLIVVVACSVTYVVLQMVDLLLGLWREKIVSAQDKIFADMLFPLLRNVAKAALVVAAAVLTADNLGIKITSLLAGLSVGGLALGLAAQDTVANLFGAVAVFLDKPFHLGDTIKVEEVVGVVESIGLRSTRIRNPDGHHVTVPNKTMGNAIITNVSQRPSIKTVANLTLARTLPADKVKRGLALLQEIYRRHPMTEQVWISFNQFSADGINILVLHWWKGADYEKYLTGMQELNLAIKESFDAEGISFASAAD